MSKRDVDIKSFIGKYVTLDLGQIGPSKLKVLGIKGNKVILEHWNGKQIDLSSYEFAQQVYYSQGDE